MAICTSGQVGAEEDYVPVGDVVKRLLRGCLYMCQWTVREVVQRNYSEGGCLEDDYIYVPVDSERGCLKEDYVPVGAESLYRGRLCTSGRGCW